MGKLSKFPFHAAGDYSKRRSKNRATQYCISSYAPSLQSLFQAWKSETLATPSSAAKAALVKTNQGKHSRSISNNLDTHFISPETLRSRQSFLATIPRVDILHLSCELVRNSGNYGASGLRLHDSDSMDDIYISNIETTLREAVKASAGRPIIVFLEAASINSLQDYGTFTMGDLLNKPSAPHIMMATGFGQIAGPLWYVDKGICHELQNEFYKILLSNQSDLAGYTGNDRVAYAVHAAVTGMLESHRRLWQEPCRWATFCHYGG